MKRLLLLLVTVLFSALALAAVNINTADRAELEALPEIGPVKAQAIIDYRNANGPFKSPEDVMKVNGIKEGIYGKIKGDISVSGANVPPAAKAGAASKSMAKSAPSAAPAAATAGSASESMKAEAKTRKTKTSKADESMAKADAAAPTAMTKEDKAAKAKADKEAKAKAKADKAAKAKADKEAAAEAKAAKQ